MHGEAQIPNSNSKSKGTSISLNNIMNKSKSNMPKRSVSTNFVPFRILHTVKTKLFIYKFKYRYLTKLLLNLHDYLTLSRNTSLF